MGNSEEFYQTHLNRVSRSFAFCIGKLDSPLKAWVGLTYLICRVLDTIEDAAWNKPETQQIQFNQFDQFLNGAVNPKSVLEWSQKFPLNLPDSEKQLLHDSPVLFQDLQSSPSKVRFVLEPMIRSMSRGMQHFSSRKEGNQLRLHNLKEVNQYCFFVAGVVGEALAKLLNLVEPQFQLVKIRIKEAHQFGLFLQKVNILKDQLGDEKEGRFLVPSRQQLVLSLEKDLRGAFSFLRSIPVSQKSFRLFCAWSLFLGLMTLRKAEEAFQDGESTKVDRADAEKMMQFVEDHISDNEALESFVASLGFSIEQEKSAEALEANSESIEHLYEGVLSKKELQELGVA